MPESHSVVNIDTLFPDQKELAKRYAELSGFEGVVSAVILGREEWDVRPLILKSGKLYLLRTVPSEVFTGQRQLIDLRYLFPRLKQAGLVSPDLQTGEAAGKYWVIRPYFKTTLDLADPQTIASIKDSGIPWLIGEIKQLQASAYVHGHICPSNVVIDDTKLHLVDHGFFLHRGRFGHGQVEAPELALGVSPEADIYGLASVFEKLLDSSELSMHRTFLNSMLSHDPQLRPSIGEVEAHFLDKRVIQQSPKPKDQRLASGGVILGQGAHAATYPAIGKIISEDRQEPKPVKSLSTSSLLLVLGIFAFVLWYVRYDLSMPDLFPVVEEKESPPRPSAEQVSFTEMWTQGSEDQRRKVASAAVSESNLEAQRAILMAAVKGTSPEGVRSSLLKRGFDSRWAKNLAPVDRQAVFVLSIGEYLSDQERRTAPLSSLHPGVILAVVSTAPLNFKSEQISSIELVELRKLPKPIGLSFDVISKEGYKNFSSKVPRSFAHLVLGDVTEQTVAGYFSDVQGVSSTRLSRLLLVMPHLADDSAALVWNVLAQSPQDDALSKLQSWFTQQSIVDWQGVSPASKLRIMLGAWPGEDFSIEMLADLLTFPDEKIGTRIIEILRQKNSSQASIVLANAMVRGKIVLSRSQSASLILALSLPGDSSHQFLTKWFSLNPSADVVVTILKVINGKAGSERLAIESARYLSGLDWQPSRDVIVALSGHSEPLVRAVAYSKFDISNKQERLILEKRRALEKDQGLKRRLGEMLDGV